MNLGAQGLSGGGRFSLKHPGAWMKWDDLCADFRFAVRRQRPLRQSNSSNSSRSILGASRATFSVGGESGSLPPLWSSGHAVKMFVVSIGFPSLQRGTNSGVFTCDYWLFVPSRNRLLTWWLLVILIIRSYIHDRNSKLTNVEPHWTTIPPSPEGWGELPHVKSFNFSLRNAATLPSR